MKKYKRIYIEITNMCNLSCSFCSKSNKKKKTLTIKEFEHILKSIDDYTDYIYLHIKGEPLLHPNLEDILKLAEKYNKKVNITTNGTLLKEKKDILISSKSIRQINISLHSENNKNKYLEEIFEVVDILSRNINFVYRFWTLDDLKLNKISTGIVDKIVSFYNLSREIVEKIEKEPSIKLKDNIYISKANQFEWPSLENNYYNDSGYCYALKTQIGILVDGNVVPCCLDGEGIIDLGNIFEDSFEYIINSKKVKDIEQGFRNRKVKEELCKHCSYKEKF